MSTPNNSNNISEVENNFNFEPSNSSDIIDHCYPSTEYTSNDTAIESEYEKNNIKIYNTFLKIYIHFFIYE